MAANAKNYSVGGVADLTGLTLGTNFGTSGPGQFLAGNTFGSLWAAWRFGIGRRFINGRSSAGDNAGRNGFSTDLR
jgi:hypothetical protein